MGEGGWGVMGWGGFLLGGLEVFYACGDFGGGDAIALLYPIDDIHSLGHVAKDGVVAIEKAKVSEGEVKLGGGGVGHLGAGHGDRAPLMFQRRQLPFEGFAIDGLIGSFGLDFEGDDAFFLCCRVNKAAGAVAFGVAALGNEGLGLADDAVEAEAVVKAALDEIDEVASGDGGFGAINFDGDGFAVNDHFDRGFAVEAGEGGGEAIGWGELGEVDGGLEGGGDRPRAVSQKTYSADNQYAEK